MHSPRGVVLAARTDTLSDDKLILGLLSVALAVVAIVFFATTFLG